MSELSSSPVLNQFLAVLARAPLKLLALDYDGTLAPFTHNREEAALYPGIAPLLTNIITLGTTIAFITGRPARDLASRLPISGVEIYGSHGNEHLSSDGLLHPLPLTPAAENALAQIAKTLESKGWQAHLEYKHGTVAIHWRAAPPETQRSLQALTQDLCKQLPPALLALPFEGGFEFRARGYDKGTAMTHLLTRHAGAAVAYLGDDLTDEDAFAVLPPFALGVLVRTEARPTRAALWIKPPEELTEFLALWKTACQV